MTEQARILIVDDEPTVQKLLVLTFKSQPWHVEAVGSAEDALERCRAQKYDLLVLDKNLPEMSGPELLRILRDEGDAVACIMMTAYASAESAVEMMALGVDAYLEKPFPDLEEVGAKVEEVLSQHRDGQRRSKDLAAARDHFRRAQVALGGDLSDDSTESAEESVAGNLAIVIACPSQADRDLLSAELAGERLTLVLSGSELIDRLERGAVPDLVIVDAVVAGGALTDFVSRLRKLAPGSGFVVVSDSVPLKLVTDLIDAGVDALIERPLDAASFARNTEHLLRRLR